MNLKRLNKHFTFNTPPQGTQPEDSFYLSMFRNHYVSWFAMLIKGSFLKTIMNYEFAYTIFQTSGTLDYIKHVYLIRFTLFKG